MVKEGTQTNAVAGLETRALVHREVDEYGRSLGSETELRPFNDRRLELCELLFGNRACRR